MHRWKISTLALASAIALVTGRAAVRSAEAEPPPMDVALHDLRHAKEAIHEVEEGLAWARDHH